MNIMRNKTKKYQGLPISILLLTISLSSCSPKPKISRVPSFSVETKETAIKSCIEMKKKEYNWTEKEMVEYCTEQWRGYISFTEETKNA